jgi:hypothetical protein
LAWSKSKDYWRKVERLIEKRNEQIKIKRDKLAQIEKVLEGSTSAPHEWRDWYEFVCTDPDRYDPRGESYVRPDYDTPYDSIHEYARGIRKLEMADAKRKAFTRSVSTVAVANVPTANGAWRNAADSGNDDGAARAIGPWRQGTQPISYDEWKARGYGVKAAQERLIHSREDRDSLARIFAKSPGRLRGRPLKGERAMTSTERSRKRRARFKEAAE